LITEVEVEVTNPRNLEDHKMDLYVSDILALMDNLRLKKSAFWGYSDGARVGFTLASRYPDRISALIASGNYGEWNPAEEMQSLIATLRKNGTGSVIEELENFEELKAPEPLRSNLLKTPDPEIFALNEEAWLRYCNYDLVPVSFTTPTMIVNGEKEDPEHKGEMLARRIPRSRAIAVKGLGHLGSFVRSDLVLPAVLEFLESIAGESS
jgi:pimeloyl-ACP methyl ester carboxylesterase